VERVPIPTPIGVGPAYHPAPAVHAACTPGALVGARRVHLELFAHGRVVIVPTGIGLRSPRVEVGRVVSARCRAPLRTLDPTGVVHIDGRATLGDLFAVWGRRLAPRRLLSFRGDVRLYRNGRRVLGDPRGVPLRDLDELVLEVGVYVPPHSAYRFPPH
jgi:hypothetical protein